MAAVAVTRPRGLRGLSGLVDDMVATADPRNCAAAAFPGANQARGGRVRIPYSGTLTDLGILVGTSQGNISVAISRPPDGSGNKARAYTTGAIACPASGGRIVSGVGGAPALALAVVEGEWLEFSLSCDNTSATFAREAPSGQALPQEFGAYPNTPTVGYKPAWFASTAHPVPDPLTEAGTGPGGWLPLIYARVVPPS